VVRAIASPVFKEKRCPFPCARAAGRLVIHGTAGVPFPVITELDRTEQVRFIPLSAYAEDWRGLNPEGMLVSS
jgi:hypothetical protein